MQYTAQLSGAHQPVQPMYPSVLGAHEFKTCGALSYRIPVWDCYPV